MSRNGFKKTKGGFAWRYIVSLTTVLACYLIYNYTFAIWIQGDEPGRAKAPAYFSLENDRFDPTVYFAEGSWERGPCKILRTQYGYLLFKDYQPFDDGRVEVTPVSMVIPSEAIQGMTNGNAPIILRAPEGAMLQFDRRVSIGGGFGKFQRGELLGKIRITRNDSELEHKDRFEITTSQVLIQRDRIETTQTVDFEFGPHQGLGRHLTISMDPPNPKRSREDGQSRISEIRLRHVTEMVIDNRVSQAPKAQPALLNSSNLKTSAMEQARFRVTCQGPLIYAVKKESLTLTKNVVANRLDVRGDSMSCEALQLLFDKNRKSTKPGSANAIRRMIAAGKPAVIKLISQQTYLQGETIDLDLQKSSANLTGPGLYLKQKDFEFQCAALQYQMNSDKSIGIAAATGPGVLTQQRNEGKLVTTFNSRLLIRPQDDRKVISLYEKTSVQMGTDTRLDADELHLWIREYRATNPLGNQAEVVWQRSPEQLLAKGNVEIQSPELNGSTRQLTAKWNGEPSFDLANASETNSSQPAANPAFGHVASRDAVVAKKKPKSKLFFYSESVELALPGSRSKDLVRTREAKRNTLPGFEQVDLNRSVVISDRPFDIQNRDSLEGDLERLLIVGDAVMVQSRGTRDTPLYYVEIGADNQLASLQSKGTRIQGNPIYFDQQAARAWVQGPGQIDLKTMERVDARTNSLNSVSQSRQQDVQVRWFGGMVFDGMQIYFENAVEADVTRVQAENKTKSISSAFATALTLVLDRPIDLTDPKASRRDGESPKIDKMILAGSELIDDQTAVFKKFWQKQPSESDRLVNVKNVTKDPYGKTQSVQQIRIPSAIAYGFSGDIQARGPGLIQVWHRPEPNKFATASMKKTPGLTFTQVNFDGSLVGNTKNKSLVLKRRVRAFHSPADSFSFAVDPDRVRNLTAESVKMDCDQMQLNQWQPQASSKPQVELVASGNTSVRSLQFAANGNRIRYNQSRDKVIIEGDAPNFATLTHRKTQFDRPSTATAAKFTYNVKSQTYEAENIKRAETNANVGRNK